MNNCAFDRFWDNSVLPSINYCLSTIDKNDKEMLELTHVDLLHYKEELSSLFWRKREWLKKEYLPDEGANATLDFHKLSAVMCRCIIGNKYFSFSSKKAVVLYEYIEESTLKKTEKLEREINSIYINYKLAFHVAAAISYYDLAYRVCEKKDQENNSRKVELLDRFNSMLHQNSELYLYKKSKSHDDFVSSIIVALMKNDYLLRDFDYLAFAAIMFQWQEYTKLQICYNMLVEDIQPKPTIAELRDLV